MKLEICSHVWNYSRLLAYQLSSLLLAPPANVSTIITIFYSKEDEPTVEMLRWFGSRSWPKSVQWRWWPLERQELCRRAIGRDMLCRETQADWIWFCDVDYLFGLGCIDELPAELHHVAGPLAFPRYTLRSISHDFGDAAIEAVTSPAVYPINPAEYTTETNRRAIGGIQIVRGDVAREIGYCRDTRWQRPANQWRRTFEDMAYRGILGTNGQAIQLPNLYRIRHSKRGRFDVGVQL